MLLLHFGSFVSNKISSELKTFRINCGRASLFYFIFFIFCNHVPHPHLTFFSEISLSDCQQLSVFNSILVVEVIVFIFFNTSYNLLQIMFKGRLWFLSFKLTFLFFLHLCVSEIKDSYR